MIVPPCTRYNNGMALLKVWPHAIIAHRRVDLRIKGNYMIDFPSLIILGGLLIGFVAGDAALYGDSLRVQIAVPQALSNAGFTQPSAEAVFMTEAARVVRGDSIIPAPSLRVHAAPSVITDLAKPLSLDAVVTALQVQLGIDNLSVTGAILAETGAAKAPAPEPVHPLTSGTKLDMVVVVVRPKQAPVQTLLEQPDGDATKLVRRAADWAMEHVSPYRLALSHFLAGMNGDPSSLVEAKATADRLLAKPWTLSGTSERALIYNITALLALRDNKLDDADSQLAQTDAIPDVLPQARAELALNHSFVAVALKHPQRAAALLDASRRASEEIDLPGFPDHLAVQEALVAYAAGDLATAEAKLRDVSARLPQSETVHHYLASVLRAKGDVAGALKEEQAERQSFGFDGKDQALAVLQFWTDPTTGGVIPRP